MSTSSKVVRFADDCGPVAILDTSGKYGVARYNASTTVQSASLPFGWLGHEVSLLSSGSNTDFAYGIGSTGPALVFGANAAIGVGSITAGFTAINGREVRKVCPTNATFISWVSDTAVGKVMFYVSDGTKESPAAASGSYGPQP